MEVTTPRKTKNHGIMVLFYALIGRCHRIKANSQNHRHRNRTHQTRRHNLPRIIKPIPHHPRQYGTGGELCGIIPGILTHLPGPIRQR